ncbi:hypothetical protein JCM3775_001486 [Rhodotorula graminis]
MPPTVSPRSTHGHSNDSSDYLLLTSSEHSPLLPSSSSGSRAPTSSRPPRLALLRLAAAADLCTTIALALRVPVTALPPSAVALNLARPLVVLVPGAGAACAPVMLGQLVLSTLVLLYRLNELVQTTTVPPSEAAAWLLLNPTTAWYLASFAFAPLEYALFLALVGVPRRGAGARAGLRGSSRWAAGERPWEGAVERVGASARSERSLSVGGAGGGAGLGEMGAWDDPELDAASSEDDDDGGSLLSSDDDADDLVDVPRGGGAHLSSPRHERGEPTLLRNRASRASLLSVLAPPTRDGGEEDRPGFGASRGYGSIRSLAGI